jgi:hypothetical protein
MQAHRLRGAVGDDHTLKLENLPIPAGEEVEVLVLVDVRKRSEQKRYPLRGLPVSLEGPTEPVAESDWEANR